MSVWPYTFLSVDNSYKNCVKSLTSALDIGNIKNAIFAFVTIDDNNDKICDNFYQNLNDMKLFVSSGGKLRISFRENNKGIMLDEAIIDEDDLYNIYIDIITKSNCYDLDFYIIGENVLKNNIHKKRNNVLLKLQKTYPDLKICYTLSCSLNGIYDDSYILLENTIKSGVDINMVNCIFANNDLNNENNEPNGSINSINGIKASYYQIQKIWPNKGVKDLYNMLGMCFIIGQNDELSFFSLADAENVVNYINSIDGIGQISYFFLHRDTVGSGDKNKSSLFNVDDFNFYNIFSKIKNKEEKSICMSKVVKIGDKVLGSLVLQHTRTNWIKVNDITMGDTPEFGYKILKNKDVDDLLSLLEKDDNANVVNYNLLDGKAYIKTNYNLNSENDCSVNNGFVTFMKK